MEIFKSDSEIPERYKKGVALAQNILALVIKELELDKIKNQCCPDVMESCLDGERAIISAMINYLELTTARGHADERGSLVIQKFIESVKFWANVRNKKETDN